MYTLFFLVISFFFFFNDTATTEIYTLSLHDALPIYRGPPRRARPAGRPVGRRPAVDRKSTRLNSSHVEISYAVFCLKNKKNIRVNAPCETTGNERQAQAEADEAS